MKIRTKDNLLDAIQSERAWRRKELTNIQSLIYKARDSSRHTIVRGGVLLLYAHWEGYIKEVCKFFFVYLNFKAIYISQLTSNYKALGMLDEFKNGFPKNKFSSYKKSVKFILDEGNSKKFKIDVEAAIDTKSNLNSEVLFEFLEMIGVDSTYFRDNKYHIDGRLLKYRNAIAHGERTDNNPELIVSKEDFSDLYERIRKMMDHFESLIMNHVEMEKYKALEISKYKPDNLRLKQ